MSAFGNILKNTAIRPLLLLVVVIAAFALLHGGGSSLGSKPHSAHSSISSRWDWWRWLLA